jgi:hypothetical protein
MNNLHYIHSILPHIDDAFSEFYKAMLSDEKLSIFFENSEQIEKLVELQKNAFYCLFRDARVDTTDELCQTW